jgi:glycosyltransferase involved in cell wall biosynthesis
MPNSPLSVGILIRFSDSAATLPAVLNALKRQTLQPDRLLGVNSGGTDASPELIRAAGGQVVDWAQPYSHSAVLNFGLTLLPTDLVLVLSSHTVLESPDTLAKMVAVMHDPAAACVSLAWDMDPFYSDAIRWSELQHKGLRFGSFYSNSMGMIRRRLWEESRFDEDLLTAEDYAWSLDQLQQGHTCYRLHYPFSYRRSGSTRDGEFAQVTFHLAKKHRLKVAWLGPKASLRELAQHRLRRLLGRTDSTSEKHHTQAIRQRLTAWLRTKLGWSPSLIFEHRST